MSNSKVSVAEANEKRIKEEIENKKLDVEKAKSKTFEEKKLLKESHISKLRSDLNVAKSCAKTGAKAVAKNTCKAAICATVV